MRLGRWALVGLLLLGLWWGHTRPAPAVSRIATTVPAVALTFDDGPEAPYTAEILQLLQRYHDRATFFVLGNKVQEFPDLLKAEAAAAMEIGLHGGTHLNLRRVGAVSMVQDALSERGMLRRLVPHLAVDLFRPPYGYQSKALERLLAAQHLTLVLWDVDTRDWTRPGVSYIVTQVERLVRPGSIVLFHDGGGNRRQTVEALAILLPWFRQHHYRLVTVSSLLETAGQ